MKTHRTIPSIIFFIVLLVTACSFDSGKTEITVSFPKHIWNRFDIVDTVFTISDVKRTYDISVSLSVMDGFKLDRVPFETVITSPDGQQNILNRVFVTKNDEGHHIGTVHGDVWTVRQSIYTDKEFTEAGEYRISIQNRTQYFELFKTESLHISIIPVKK